MKVEIAQQRRAHRYSRRQDRAARVGHAVLVAYSTRVMALTYLHPPLIVVISPILKPTLPISPVF